MHILSGRVLHTSDVRCETKVDMIKNKIKTKWHSVQRMPPQGPTVPLITIKPNAL